MPKVDLEFFNKSFGDAFKQHYLDHYKYVQTTPAKEIWGKIWFSSEEEIKKMKTSKGKFKKALDHELNGLKDDMENYFDMWYTPEQKACNAYFKQHPKKRELMNAIEKFFRAQYAEWLIRESKVKQALGEQRLTVLSDGGMDNGNGCLIVYTALDKDDIYWLSTYAYQYSEEPSDFPRWLVEMGLGTEALEGVVQWVSY